MPSVEIHAPSTNRRHHGDHVEKRKKSTRRLPFSALSTNTPSKVQQTTNKPVKSSLQRTLQRTYSAPLPQSPPIFVEKEKKQEEQSSSENKEEIFNTSSRLEFDEELEDLWTLKRANPIDEDEEDDELLSSPTKRARTYTYFDEVPETRDEEPSERQILGWNDRITEDKSGFSLRF